MDIDKWAHSLAGRRIDADGAYPGECHDVFVSYVVARGGTVSDAYTVTGWTNGSYDYFPRSPRMGRLFVKLPRQQIRRGDVVFWRNYQGYGLPHVAVALGDERGGWFKGIDQRPHNAMIHSLPAAGVYGILRPRTFRAARPLSIKPKPRPLPKPKELEPEEELMRPIAIFYKESHTYHVALMNTVSGFFSEYSTDHAPYNNQIAKGMQTGSFTPVTKKHYLVLKEDCRKVREALSQRAV